MEYGGFWIRVVASIIDSFVLIIPHYLLRFLYFSTVPIRTIDELQFYNTIFLFFVVGPIYWIYEAYLTSTSWQATFGKKALGLKVIDYSGKRISFARATGRYFAKVLSGIILGIGFLMVGWTKRKQGLHDFMANTLVIKADRDVSKFSFDFKDEDLITCPYCAEKIKKEAKICKHCHMELVKKNEPISDDVGNLRKKENNDTSKVSSDTGLFLKNAAAAFNQKRYQEAILWFDKCIKHNSKLSDAYYGKGVILYQLGQTDEAVNNLTIAAKYGHSKALGALKKIKKSS